MKLKKTILKFLSMLLLFDCIPFSLAGDISEDSRYETFNENIVSVNDVLENDKTEVFLEGNTLANLADIESSFEIRDLNYWYNDFAICETSKLKLNTDYTFFIYKELLPNHNKNYTNFEIGLSNNTSETVDHPGLIAEDNIDNSSFRFAFNSNKDKELLKIKVQFTDFKNYKYLTVRPIRRNSTPVSTEYANANMKLVLLEGDYTREDIKYFKDIQSVGQLENTVEIKSSNKNLYPYGDITSTWSNASSDSLIGWIKVKPNTTYTASRKENSDGLVHFIEFRNNDITFSEHNNCYTKRDGQEIRLHNANSDSITFTTGSKINYLYVTVSSGAIYSHEVIHSEIMLEEGSIKTEYEPYKESVINIELKEPLRAIPNGKKDRIVKIDKKYYIERNCDEIIINLNNDNFGLNYWNSSSFDQEIYYAFYITNSSILGTYQNPIFANMKGLSNVWSDIGDIENYKEGISIKPGASPPYIGFKINRKTINSFEGDTVAQKCTNYLKSKGDMMFVLELLNPVYEELTLNTDLSIDLFEGTTHIFNSSNVPSNMKVTVDRVANKAQESIELAKANSTVENISQTRYWINLMKESILKDNFQSEINNITSAEDLIIEKKTTTANVDLYIKPQNSLSMSLSTNSIIFDEFDSTEDMEKLKAVEITVESSLPYRLNSYLVSEIKNKDGSNIIPKEQFNIRLNGEANYKAFGNVNEKLVLKDDCLAGVNNIHSVDLILRGGRMNEADIYKTTLRFEAEQK